MSPAHQRLLTLLHDKGVPFRLLDHPPCRTSAESAKARANAGAPEAVGAKALVIRMEKTRLFNLIVLPGPCRLDSKAVRKSLGAFRFATEEEVAQATDGLIPGMVPPFGRPVLPSIERVFIDTALKNYAEVGFNAACFTMSVVIELRNYLVVAGEAETFQFSQPV